MVWGSQEKLDFQYWNFIGKNHINFRRNTYTNTILENIIFSKTFTSISYDLCHYGKRLCSC